MKKQNNDTWLGFFKKTLKVTGIAILTLIIVIGISIFYLLKKEIKYVDPKTYLKCEKQGYYAFTIQNNSSSKGTIYHIWDDVELKFLDELDIVKVNKSIIKSSKINVVDNEGGPDIDSHFIFDRIGGTLALVSVDETKTFFEYKCQKITIKDLPKKNIKQKF